MMSVTEKLQAQGLEQGLEKGLSSGLWVGKILGLEEILGMSLSARERLESLPLDELEARYQSLRRDFDSRFRDH